MVVNFFRWSFGKRVIPDRICFNKTNMRDAYRAGESSSNPSFRIPIPCSIFLGHAEQRIITNLALIRKCFGFLKHESCLKILNSVFYRLYHFFITWVYRKWSFCLVNYFLLVLCSTLALLTPLAPKAPCAFSSSTNPNNYTITALFHLLLSSYRFRTSIFFCYKEKTIVTPGHNMPSKTLSFLSLLSTQRGCTSGKEWTQKSQSSSKDIYVWCSPWSYSTPVVKGTLKQKSFQEDFVWNGTSCLEGSAPLVTYILPNRTEMDCAAKGWARTGEELVADSSAFRNLHDL